MNYEFNQIKYIVTKSDLGDFKHKVYPLCTRHVKILLRSESNILVMCLLRCEMKEIYFNTSRTTPNEQRLCSGNLH